MDLLHNTKKILLVDDEAIIAANLAAILGSYGYEMRIAVSGEEGVRIAEGDAGIDLVLMDLSLGKGIDGVEAARRILEKRLLPIVFLSNYMDPSIVQKTAAVDSYGYVVKDSAESVLVTTIGMALRLHEAHRAIRNKNDEIAAANEELQSAIEELEETNDELLERERELMAEREFNRTLVESSPAFIVAISPEGAMLMMNESMRTALGYGSADEVVGADYLATFVPEEDRADLAAVFADLIRHGRQAIHENRVLAKDGRSILVEWHGRPIYRNDRLEYVIAIGIDITARRAAEREREYVRALMEQAVVQSPSGIVIATAPDVAITMVNPAALSIRGAEPGLVTGIEANEHSERWQTFRPDGSSYPGEELPLSRAVLRGETTRDEEVIIRHVDGSDRWVTVNAAPVRNTDGAIVAGVVVFHDITEKKRNEVALAESHANLQRSQEIGRIGDWRLELATMRFTASAVALRMFGFPAGSEPSFEEMAALITPDDRLRAREAMQTALAFGMPYEIEIRVNRRDDGREIIMVSRAEIECDDGGRPKALFGVNQDITDVRRVEEMLRESESRLRSFVETTTEGIVIVDEEGRLIEWNRAAESISGIAASEALGRYWWDVAIRTVPGPRRTEERKRELERLIRAALASGEPVFAGRAVFEIESTDGSRRFIEQQVLPAKTAAGHRFFSIMDDVTERVLAERALRESEERFRALTENSHDIIMRVDRNHRYLYANPAVEAQTGIPPAQFIGKSFRELGFPEELCALWDSETEQVIASGKVRRIEFAFPSGVWVDLLQVPEFDNSGAVAAVMITSRDITERKRTENALRESEERFRALTENSRDTIMRFDRDHRHLYVNPAAEAETGIASGAFIGKTHRDLGFPADLCELWETAIERVFVTGEVGRIEFTLPTGISIDWLLVPEFDPVGAVVAVMTSARDITQRKQAEDALRESEAMYRSVIENIQDVFYRSDLAGSLVMASPSLAKLTGYDSLDGLIGRPIAETFYLDPSRRMEMLTLLERDGVVEHFETTIRHRSGALIIIEVNSHYLLDSEGNRVGIEGILRDITARKRVEDELKESEEKFHTIFERSVDSCLIIDEGRYVDCNEAAVRMGGCADKSQIVGRSPMDFSPEYQPDGESSAVKAARLVASAYEQGGCISEWLHRRLDGTEHMIELMLAVIPMRGRRILYASSRDISARIAAQKALRESEERYRSLVEASPVGIFQTMPSGTIRFSNPAFATILGFPSPERMIRDIPDITVCYSSPDERARFKSRIAEFGSVYDFRVSMVRRDGQPVRVSLYATMITTPQGGVIYDGFAIDITERVVAESALRESEEQFRSIFENIRDAVGVGRGQSLLMGNRALREMFGYSAEEIAGMPVKNFLAPSVRARALSEWDIADARDGAFPRKITRGLRRDGGEFDMEASVATYRYYGNTYFMVVLRDITARLRAEEEIRRLNRHILTVQEEERQKVSRDLHDSVGQTILAAKLNVEMFQSDPSRYGDRLSMGVQFIDKASQELREIYMNLYPSILSDLGLSATIKWYANHMLEANGIRAHLRIGIRKAIAHEIEVGLYRIVQEIFSNILRHSGATEVRIELVRRKGSLALGVEDNGLGLNAGSGAPGTGHGIANMRHRAQAMGGAFSIATIPRGGTRITVTIREDGNGSH